MALQAAFLDAAFDLGEKMGRSGGRLECLKCGSHCLWLRRCYQSGRCRRRHLFRRRKHCYEEKVKILGVFGKFSSGERVGLPHCEDRGKFERADL